MKKTLYFIRHAEAKHNPDVDKYGKDILTDWKYFDAKLTIKGKEQRKELLKKKELFKNIDVIFVSPLHRTLETAEILHDFKKPIIALEIIRERLGVRPCDKRKNIKKYKDRFTKIDFKLCEDKDVMWKLDHRETEEELKQRIINFLRWIKKQPYKKIAIITHNGYILRLCNKVLNKKVEMVQNCEIFKVII